MWNWLQRLLGKDRYAMAWDFTTSSGVHLKGREDRRDTKLFAQHLVDAMNKDYGADTHWVERV